MITDINSEDRLVQQTFAEYLHDVLGWDSVYAWHQETFGPHGSLGRDSEREVVLVRDESGLRLVRVRDLFRTGGIADGEAWREMMAARGAIVTIEDVAAKPWHRVLLEHARRGRWRQAVAELIGRI